MSTISTHKLSDNAHRAIAGAVILAILAALAGIVVSQRVADPSNGQALNVVQGVAARLDLPKGWKAARVSGIDYVAVSPTGSLPKAVVDSLAKTVAVKAKAAGSAVYWPNAEVDALQKSTGKNIVAVYYGHIDSSGARWIVYSDYGPDHGNVDQVDSRALAVAEADSWAKRDGSTVVVAG
jgi:hypothetical protein